jgi:hypothetical protein
VTLEVTQEVMDRIDRRRIYWFPIRDSFVVGFFGARRLPVVTFKKRLAPAMHAGHEGFGRNVTIRIGAASNEQVSPPATSFVMCNHDSVARRWLHGLCIMTANLLFA